MADAFVVLERLAMMNLNYLRDPERYPKLQTSYTSSVIFRKMTQMCENAVVYRSYATHSIH